MGNRGVLTKNYFIDPVTVLEFGAEIESVMTETDRAMEEASEIIAEIASLTERVPSRIRSRELLELCETAQTEIRSFDFLAYGKRVNQGLQNLVDRNEYITNNFIKKTEANTERIREFGAACRRLTELIDYSGESLPFKGLALSAVGSAENENSDCGKDDSSNQGFDDAFIRAGAAEVLEVNAEEVQAWLQEIRFGQRISLKYMINHRIADREKIDRFIDWLAMNRPELLAELYAVDSKSSKDAVYVIDKIMILYKTLQGADILTDFLCKPSGDIKDEDKPELIVPFLYFFYSDKLIELYESDISKREDTCQELIDFYLHERDDKNVLWGKIFYAYTWKQINNIESFTYKADNSDFDNLVDDFVTIYGEYKEIYMIIAEETGIPPEVVAVIHYRENSQDFLNKAFNVDITNGSLLTGDKTQEDFIECAIDAIQKKQWCINLFHLTINTNDIVAMVCFAEAYNGMGYYDNDYISPYCYSGTNIYVSGKYVSDGKYDVEIIDQQIGTYRLLLAVRAGIYEAEAGKEYVNEMCVEGIK